MNKKILNKALLALNSHKNLAMSGSFVFLGFVLFFGLLTFNSEKAYASSTQGPNNSSNITTWSGIDQPWSNETNAATSDNSYAESTVEAFQTSDYLVLDSFGFSIPTGATIDGIQVTIERDASSATRITDTYLSLLVGGSPSGSSLASGTPWGATEVSVDYGGNGNNWGNSLTPSDVNDNSFGVVFMVQSVASKPATAFVDNIRVTVFYTPAVTYGLTSTQSGNFTAGTTWGGTCTTACSAGVDYPGIGESVTIASGHNVTVPADTTVSAVTVNGGGTLTISSGITLTLAGTGTPLSISGTFTPGTGTIKYKGSTANVAPTTYYNLTLGDGGTETHTLIGTTNVTNVVTINSTATLSTGSQTLTLSGSGTPLVKTGSLNAGTGTIQYTSGSGVTALSTASTAYYNLVINGTGTFNTGSIGSISTGGDLTVTSGTLTGAISIEVDGGDVTGNGTITMTGSTFYVFGGGTGNFGGNTNWSFNSLVLGEDVGITITATGSGSITTGTLYFNGVINAGSKTWIITGSGTPFTGGINDAGTSTFSYRSTTGATLNSNISYYNLDISPASGSFPTFTVGSSNMTVSGNLTMAGVGTTTLNFNNIASYLSVNGNVSIASGNLFTAPPSGATFYIGGSFTNSYSFSHNNGTIQFNATSTGKTISTNGNDLYNVVFNGSGGGWSPSAAMVLAGDLAMNAGTLSGTQNITVNGGDVTGNATINMTGGTFLVDGNSSTGFGGNTAWTFSNLTFGDGSGTASTTATGTGSITVTGTLTTAVNQTLNAGSKTYILSGTGTPLTNNGGFNSNTSTFQYTGSTATLVGFTYYNVTLGGTGTYTLPSTTYLNGSLVVTSGATVVKGASGISLIGTGNQTITDNNSTKQDLGNIQVSNTAPAWCNISSVACNSSWTSRKKITFDNSASSSNLTSFPVLVSLSSSNISYAKTLNNGQDIRFVDADGTTALSYQIEEWNESGTSTVWVKVPQLDNTATDFIWMYYNNPAATDNQSASSVWDSSFKGVYHLPNGSSLNANDSTSNAYNGSVSNATAVSGKVGGGANFNGSNAFISNGSLSLTAGSSVTVSYWEYQASADVQTNSVFNVGATDNPNRAQAHSPWSDNTLYWDYGDSGAGGRVTANYSSYLNSWAYVTVSYNSATNAHTIYINGVSVGSSTNANTTTTTRTGLELGRWVNYFKGKLDEFRISSTARSADWVRAEYNSTNNSMNTFSTEETYGSTGVLLGSSIKATALTIDAAKSFSLNGSNTLTLTGNGASVFVPTGTFFPSTGIVEFASASTTGTTIPATTYYGLNLNKTGNTFTSAGTITARDVSVLAGTFVAPSGNLTLNAGLFVSGTFNHNSGTIVLVPEADTLASYIENSSVSTLTLNNVTLTTPGTYIGFGEAHNYAFAGTLTLTGARGRPISVRSFASAEQWTVTFSSMPSLSYVAVLDSACSGGLTVSQNQNIINLGNNGSCWGFADLSAGAASSGGGRGGSTVSNATSAIYTASGTWVAPAGITSVDVEVWGGGAGGAYYTGGGGGGGAYSRKNSISVTPGNSYTVTVGAGGNETAGGDSWFSTSGTVLAKGGSIGIYGFGGGGPPCTGGAGGAAASGIGDVKYSGGAGGTGTCYTGVGGGGGGGAGSGGNGGAASGATAGAGGTGSGGRGGTGAVHDAAPQGINSGDAIGGGGGAWALYDPPNHPRGGRGEVRIYYNGAGGGSGGGGSSGGSGGSGGSSGGGGSQGGGGGAASP